MATPDGPRAGPDPRTLTAFVLAVVMGGGNSVAIRYVSCEACELDPFWSASIRFLIGGAVFAVIARVLRTPWPQGRALTGAVLYGILQFGVGFGLVYWGLVRTPAGLGQVLIASVPLLTFALALVHRQERFRWDGLVGAALAVGGIAVVFGSGIRAGVPLSSMAAMVAGALCWAEALVVLKGFPPVHPAAMNAVGMLVGTAVLLVLTAIFREAYAVPQAGSAWAALTYLIVAGSVAVFWLYVFVVRRWTASAASYQLVLLPLVAIVLSAWLQDERITWTFAVGSVLVVAGVYFGALRRLSAPERRAEIAEPIEPIEPATAATLSDGEPP